MAGLKPPSAGSVKPKSGTRKKKSTTGTRTRLSAARARTKAVTDTAIVAGELLGAGAVWSAGSAWQAAQGRDLKVAKKADRQVLQKVIESDGSEVLSHDEADSLLRVINEARLALAARLGLDVEEDHDQLPEDSRQVLDYLGWILEELTVELSRSL